MSRGDDRWRLPALERLGTQLRELEGSPTPGAEPTRPRRRRAVRAVLIAGVVAVLGLSIPIVELVSPAGAQSPVNRAPREARRASTVEFVSVVEASLNGRDYTRLTEHGALDFRHDRLATSLSIPGSRATVERRKVADTLYLAQLAPRTNPRLPKPWLTFKTTPADARRGLGQGYTLMEPQVVFGVLERAAAGVRIGGTTVLRGMRATRYSLATSLSALLRLEYGPSYRRGSGGPAARLSVWLDGDGRPLRVSVTFSERTPKGRAALSLSIDFRHYGQRVSIAAPPPELQRREPLTRADPPLLDPTRVLERVLFATPTAPRSR